MNKTLEKGIADLLFKEIHGGFGTEAKWDSTQKAARAVVDYLNEKLGPVDDSPFLYDLAKYGRTADSEPQSREAEIDCLQKSLIQRDHSWKEVYDQLQEKEKEVSDYRKALEKVRDDPNKHPAVGKFIETILAKWKP